MNVIGEPIARWKEQLDNYVTPYLSVALKQSAALQVILYLDTDGKVGGLKVTVKPPLESKAKNSGERACVSHCNMRGL